MSELLLLGVSHKTAPVGLRERVALTEGQVADFLAALLAADAVHEAVAISTCNRTEIFLVAGDPVEAETAALGMLVRQAGIRPTELASTIYSLRNCDAARHLFRVTSGLESMIVGEAEVQGQVRRSYECALETGATGPLTNRVFRAALATGKRVRSETAIGEGATSVSSVAVDLARELLGELGGRRVIVLGAGETGELTAEALAGRGADMIFVANRRRNRAQSVARRFGGRVVGFDDFPAELEQADIVVAATSSPHAIVGEEELEAVMAAREGRPLLMVDIAVPRDVEPGCAAIEGVSLHDIDDLQAVVARHRSGREAEAVRAEAIVEQEIQRFSQWLGSLEVVPTIQALRGRAGGIVERVLAENAGRWETMSAADLERIALVARVVASRLLHEPTVRLKDAPRDRAHAHMHLLRELFALEEEAREGGEERRDDAAEVRRLPRRGER
ncbi:MAG: glutamyl-tRNA reductase [Solirubrobacteraceae bacterium]